MCSSAGYGVSSFCAILSAVFFMPEDHGTEYGVRVYNRDRIEGSRSSFLSLARGEIR